VKDAMTEELSQARPPLVDDISQTFDKLPPINLFRAAANATTLYPAFIQYMYLLLKPLELDGRIERLIVLYVGKLSEGSLYLVQRLPNSWSIQWKQGSKRQS
jgi:hypothetical protein